MDGVRIVVECKAKVAGQRQQLQPNLWLVLLLVVVEVASAPVHGEQRSCETYLPHRQPEERHAAHASKTVRQERIALPNLHSQRLRGVRDAQLEGVVKRRAGRLAVLACLPLLACPAEAHPPVAAAWEVLAIDNRHLEVTHSNRRAIALLLRY
jgi:hypothetical protein